MKRENLEKLVFYGILLIFSGCIVWLYFYNSKILNNLCKEDGFVEYLTSVFYFLASGLFLFANKKHRFKNMFFWFLAAMCFAIGGEEISWGQRIFGIETPSNCQGFYERRFSRAVLTDKECGLWMELKPIG